MHPPRGLHDDPLHAALPQEAGDPAQAVGVVGGAAVPPVGWMSGVFPRTSIPAPAVVMVSRSRARDGPVPGPGIHRDAGG